jgi:hypothetical protein
MSIRQKSEEYLYHIDNINKISLTINRVEELLVKECEQTTSEINRLKNIMSQNIELFRHIQSNLISN